MHILKQTSYTAAEKQNNIYDKDNFRTVDNASNKGART